MLLGRLTIFKKPMIGRLFIVAAAAALTSAPAGSARAQTLVVDEREAVQRALARDDVLERNEAERAIAAGRTRATAAYLNPTLSYLREQTYGPYGTGEDYLSVAQTVDLGNRFGLRRRAGKQREEAARLQAKIRALEIATETRHRFYTLLYGTRREHVLNQWRAQLDDALRVVSLREQHGDAALYDRRRLERERVMVEGLIEREQIRNDTNRRLLGVSVGLAAQEAGRLEIRGELLPEPSSAGAESAHPAEQALTAQQRAARGDEVAARRLKVPDLRIEGGWKGLALQSGGRTDGFLLSGTLQVPLWDHGQGQQQVAAGEARSLHAQEQTLARTLRGDRDAYRHATDAFRALAVSQRAKTSALAADLRRMAHAGYQGGELSILELLDAYRGALEDELTVLEIEHAARTASVEWLRARGEAPR
jgi:cobalt-zinc-cadmium efflux system outer membrane protein